MPLRPLSLPRLGALLLLPWFLTRPWARPAAQHFAVTAAPGFLELEVEGIPRIKVPGPPQAQLLSLRFYHSPSAAKPQIQELLGLRLKTGSTDRELLPPTSTLRTTEAPLPVELPAQFRLELETRATDFNIVFGRPDGKEGLAFIIRPEHNDLAWAEVKGGTFEWMRELQPLAPMSKSGEAVKLFKLALELAGKAGLLLLTLLALEALLRPLPLPAFFSALPRPSWLLPLLALALAAWVADSGFGRFPHVSDEISAMFQAKLMAGGRLSAPLPPEPEAFRMDHMLMDAGGWRSKYAPLWPLALAAGWKLGAAWLVMPLALGLSVALLLAWGRRADPAHAGGAALLLAGSPFAIVMSGSYFNHSLALLATLLLLYGTWKWVEKNEPPWPALAGMAILASLRPFSALCLLPALWIWAGGPRRWHLGLAFCAAWGISVGLSNWAVTGDPFLSPYILYDPRDRPGFGANLGSLWTWGSPGHDFSKALAGTRVYLEDLAWRMQGWPWGLSLSLVLLNFLLRPTLSRLDFLLLLGIGTLALGHFFYWCLNLLTHGSFYWYEGAACLAWLSARGFGALKERLGSRAPRLALAAGLIWGVGVFLPRQVQGLKGFAQVDGGLARAVERQEGGPFIVFISQNNPLAYHEAFALQDPLLQGRFIFARERGAAGDAALGAAFKSHGRLFWTSGKMIPADGAKASTKIPPR